MIECVSVLLNCLLGGFQRDDDEKAILQFKDGCRKFLKEYRDRPKPRTFGYCDELQMLVLQYRILSKKVQLQLLSFPGKIEGDFRQLQELYLVMDQPDKLREACNKLVCQGFPKKVLQRQVGDTIRIEDEVSPAKRIQWYQNLVGSECPACMEVAFTTSDILANRIFMGPCIPPHYTICRSCADRTKKEAQSDFISCGVCRFSFHYRDQLAKEAKIHSLVKEKLEKVLVSYSSTSSSPVSKGSPS